MKVFIDTSALIALWNKNDTYHAQALDIEQTLRLSGYKYITSNAILLEFGNALSPKPLRKIASKIINNIQQDHDFWECVPIDPFLGKGAKLFENREDKEWGLVDCTSITIAKEYGIQEVFTADHHFEQAGFHILLS